MRRGSTVFASGLVLATSLFGNQAGAESQPGDALPDWYLPFVGAVLVTDGPGEEHHKKYDGEAIDFASYGQANVPIYSMAPGVVIYSAGSSAQDYPDSCAPGPHQSASNAYGYGNLVVIRHVLPDGSPVYSYYAHLATRAVAANDTISRPDQQVGTMGSSGCANGVHLHFSVRTGVTEGTPWWTGSPYRVRNLRDITWTSGCPSQSCVDRQITDGTAVGPALSGRSWATSASRREVIAGYYRDLLDREPDSSGLDAWDNSGLSLEDVRRGFLNSNEYARVQSIRTFYTFYLGRSADAEGLRAWNLSDQSLERIRSGFVYSDERRSKIADLYRELLQREPDRDGLDGWVNSGFYLSSIRDGFLGSDEYKRKQLTPRPSPGALTLTTPLSLSPSSGLFTDTRLTFTFAVKNTGGSPLNVAVISVPVRDPSGTPVDLGCDGGSNITIAPGASFTCHASGSYQSTGTYTFWADWRESSSTDWHQGQLGANQTFALAKPTPGALTLTTPLSLSPSSSGLSTGATLTFSFAVKNLSSSTVDANRISVPIRGPAGQPLDLACTGGTNAHIAPGAEFTCQTSGSFSFVGTYDYWADWLQGTATWHEGQLGPHRAFSLAAATRPYITLDSSTIPQGGTSSSDITVNWTIHHGTCETLAFSQKWDAIADTYPGQFGGGDYHGTSHFSDMGQSWPAGPHTLYVKWRCWTEDRNFPGDADILAMGPFNAKGIPGALTLITPLSLSPSSGLSTGTPLTFSFAVKNTGGSSLNIAVISVPVRDPSGTPVDLGCDGGTNLTIAPGASFTCRASGSYQTAGTYTFWADWRGLDPNDWHQGQLGANQTFTLTRR